MWPLFSSLIFGSCAMNICVLLVSQRDRKKKSDLDNTSSGKEVLVQIALQRSSVKILPFLAEAPHEDLIPSYVSLQANVLLV